MEQLHSLFLENILKNMSDGVIVIDFEGIVKFVNPSAVEKLGFSEKEMMGARFAKLFFNNPLNDEFSQVVLDAIYDRQSVHEGFVEYYTDDSKKYLRVISSFLSEGNEKIGVIIVFSDLTELFNVKSTFGRFLSAGIVKHLLDTPDGLQLGGSKQELTIMMSDLRGFTAMSERMDALDLIEMLNHYLEEMTIIIEKHHGTIIEFIGDGIFALFGAPDFFDDHATQAVACALEMQEKMKDINEWNTEKGFPLLEMGIGINTGEVILGNIGSEKRTKYGVVGKHVNLCGRIESYTVGNQVLISSTTRDMIGCELEIAKTMTVFPKGANGELELSQIVGMGEPFNIHLECNDSVLQHLDNPIPVYYNKINGKHEDNKCLYGGLTAVASGGAVLETSESLEVFDNILINAGGKLYCKVLDKDENGYSLQYTSIPSGYAGWLKNSKL